jgi:putative PIN family toxin of toxin-antitoxin system
MHKVIIDANVWIRFARSKDIAPLIDRFIAYDLTPIANNYLLSEISDAILTNQWMDIHAVNKLISIIREISFITIENAVFALSPDAKDNYLFDLAIQNNCAFIVSDDKNLLGFLNQPVQVHNTKWFLNTFKI